ncbi:MAG: protein arginine kinase [Veillonellales bacterium]
MSIETLLEQPLTPWMNGSGLDGDIALSSRIRLARNLEEIPFPNRANEGQLAGVVTQVKVAAAELNMIDQGKYLFVELDKLLPLQRYVLVEKHIVSPNHIQEPKNRALLLREDTAISVMINEEDHLRIQCLMPGLNLGEALALANQIDDGLEAKLDIAFNEQMGYLTACPTNLGTGLRASVMLHLPALALTRQTSRIFNAATQLGLAVRGLYGEGTEAVGNIYQISNQLTLGYTEQGIIDSLYSVVKQVVDHERRARSILKEQSGSMLADRVWRAFGTLRYARSISSQEAMAMLSEVRLGIDLEIIDEAPAGIFNELLVSTRPNFLQKAVGRTDLKAAERDQFRAKMIRDRINRK